MRPKLLEGVPKYDRSLVHLPGGVKMQIRIFPITDQTPSRFVNPGIFSRCSPTSTASEAESELPDDAAPTATAVVSAKDGSKGSKEG